MGIDDAVHAINSDLINIINCVELLRINNKYRDRTYTYADEALLCILTSCEKIKGVVGDLNVGADKR